MATQALPLKPGSEAAAASGRPALVRVGAGAVSPPAVGIQAGAAIREGGLYVRRAADEDLYRALSGGDFCYVLATTRAGKSSLGVRTAQLLRKSKEETPCIYIDLTELGSDGDSEEDWFFGLIYTLARESGLDFDADAFWQRHPRGTPIFRWTTFLREEFLPALDKRVVVFLDEVNVLLGRSVIAESFFASIRELDNSRAGNPLYQKITFCLMGIASPEALMKDAARTPFALGRSIALDDFTPTEARRDLLPGLAVVWGDTEANALLDAVMRQTSGHPYMTQRLCEEMIWQGAREPRAPEERVRAAVWEAFLNPERDRDATLRFAARYFAREHPPVPAAEMVFRYRALLEGKRPPFDPGDTVAQHLILAGLVAARTGGDGRRLEVRNRIFEQVFDLAWVQAKEAELRLGKRLSEWLAAPPHEMEHYLLRGPALKDALSRAAEGARLSPSEEAFLRASQEAEGKAAEREAELEREKRARAEVEAREKDAEAALEREQRARAEVEAAREREQRESAEKSERTQRRYVRALVAIVAALLLALVLAGWQFYLAWKATADLEKTNRALEAKTDEAKQHESEARANANLAVERQAQAERSAAEAREQTRKAEENERQAKENERRADEARQNLERQVQATEACRRTVLSP